VHRDVETTTVGGVHMRDAALVHELRAFNDAYDRVLARAATDSSASA
jgi:hypothetical protein